MTDTGINAQGFITRFFTCGPFLSVPETEIRDANQLTFEKKLRAEIAAGPDIEPESGITLGQEERDGHKWQLAQPGSDWFIDLSTFYHLLTRVEVKAYTKLVSDRARKVDLICWTYTAADIWINGVKVLENTPAVYKPVKKLTFSAFLREGENEIFIRMRTLGARDTRTILGLQINGDASGINAQLPGTQRAFELRAWLDGLKYENGSIISSTCPPCPMTVKDYFALTNVSREAETGDTWTEGSSFEINSVSRVIAVCCETDGTPLMRRIDIYERMKPCGFSPEADFASRSERLYREQGHYPFPVIMRFRAGTNTAEDYDRINGFLDIIDRREDCSDFYLNSLFRLFKNFTLPDALTQRFKNSVLNYRYWMDEEGADGMCFWSENHALLFYSNQYLAGGMFPQETFTRSSLKGFEVRRRGRRRCAEWLDDVCVHGFEEFASSGYAVITSCALLSIIDYGENDLAEKATRVQSALIKQMALHAFDGSVIAPQGRAYRAVLQPATQSSSALMNLCLPGMRDTGTSWLGAFAMSGYSIPDDLADIAFRDRDICYLCGNAQIHVRKTRDFMLTSCASPRTLGTGWGRVQETEEFSNKWIRTLNERFHGTTLIRPGAYGYQQHLMYAALSAGCASFTNHPGGASDSIQMRPGYWNGNGIMPALTQKGNRLGIIYDIPEEHPISFTHVFWPESSFDETFAEEHLLFGRVKDGYMALWTAGTLEKFDDFLASCEYRVYGRSTAYLYTMGSRGEYGSFEAFVSAVKAQAPAFDGTRLTCGDIDMEYRACFDESQFV